MGTALMGPRAGDRMQTKAPIRGGATRPSAMPIARPASLRTPISGTPGRSGLADRLPDRPAGPPTQGLRPVLARTVGSFVPRLTKPAFERYGFSAATLITDWATIIGADIARYTSPEKLKWPKRVEWSGDDVSDADRGRPGATLILAVASGRALDVQYKCAQLVERINAYFGYRAVADIRIVQVPAIKPSAGLRVPMLAAAPPIQPAKPRQELAAIAEPSLRAALERMSQGLVARKAREPTTA